MPCNAFCTLAAATLLQGERACLRAGLGAILHDRRDGLCRALLYQEQLIIHVIVEDDHLYRVHCLVRPESYGLSSIPDNLEESNLKHATIRLHLCSV